MGWIAVPHRMEFYKLPAFHWKGIKESQKRVGSTVDIHRLLSSVFHSYQRPWRESRSYIWASNINLVLYKLLWRPNLNRCRTKTCSKGCSPSTSIENIKTAHRLLEFIWERSPLSGPCQSRLGFNLGSRNNLSPYWNHEKINAHREDQWRAKLQHNSFETTRERPRL